MTIVKRENRIETLQILLCECPEAFRALDVTGGTTLHALAYDGTNEELDFLIRSGADVSHRDVYGQTAMHIAAALGRHQTVEELFDRIPTTLERNQLIRLKADNSESYFHSVVRGLGSVRTRESLAKTIACLFRLGAVDHPNADGLTAYDMAQISGDRELVDAFVMATQLS
jgi:ankyrin repeat protein